MLNFADRLIETSQNKDSALVVGLDPNVDYFPDCIRPKVHSEIAIAEAIVNFNQLVIDAVSPHAIAVKPQLAYYEMYGSHGIESLVKTIEYAKSKGLLIILDAKRGDIGPTALAYAKAYLDPNYPLCADAITVNPYLGSDGMIPFTDTALKNGNGVFILVKTSNPSAPQFQDLKTSSGETVNQKVAQYVQEIAGKGTGLHGYSSVGAVVGNTFSEDAKTLRMLMPQAIFLVPGLGAQGGKAEELSWFFDQKGHGAVVSSSRDITYRYCTEIPDWSKVDVNQIYLSVQGAAMDTKNAINKARMDRN